jgi:hypothetical protein
LLSRKSQERLNSHATIQKYLSNSHDYPSVVPLVVPTHDNFERRLWTSLPINWAANGGIDTAFTFFKNGLFAMDHETPIL